MQLTQGLDFDAFAGLYPDFAIGSYTPQVFYRGDTRADTCHPEEGDLDTLWAGTVGTSSEM